MNRIPTCKMCRSAMTEGPHIHPEQCLKAKKHDCESLQDGMVILAVSIRDLRRELARVNGLLWNTVALMGGAITIPDKGAVAVPQGFSPELNFKRNDADDAFVVEARTNPDPTPEPVAQA